MNGLARYAGYDRKSPPPMTPEQIRHRTEVAKANRRRHALRLFRQGADTLQIATHMNVREHIILRWITQERDREYAEKQI